MKLPKILVPWFYLSKEKLSFCFPTLLVHSAVTMTLEVEEFLYSKDIPSVWTDHLDKFRKKTNTKTQPTITIVHHIPFA